MWASILSAFRDSLLKGLFSLISQELERRNLIAQGRAAQYAADLQASVDQARDAAVIREQVAAMPISDVDNQLERLRHPSTANPK